MGIGVQIDAGNAINMFEEIERRAQDLSGVLSRAAEDAAASVSDVPVRTGRLAGSIRVGQVSSERAAIISDVEYAPYVFWGTKYMTAQPPTLLYGADQLAQAISDEIFRL